MITQTQVTVVGNIGADPEMRYTPTGNAVISFSVAMAHRKFDKETGKWADAGTTWYRVIAWRDLAEHCAETLQRGNRVIVVGSLAARPWEDRDGNKRETWEITADAIGPDLTYATAVIKRTTRETAPLPDDPWADNGREPATAQEPGQGRAEPAEPARETASDQARG
jgi:single-strand DNA-binding protein